MALSSQNYLFTLLKFWKIVVTCILDFECVDESFESKCTIAGKKSGTSTSTSLY
jgi:hypothetical protein